MSVLLERFDTAWWSSYVDPFQELQQQIGWSGALVTTNLVLHRTCLGSVYEAPVTGVLGFALGIGLCLMGYWVVSIPKLCSATLARSVVFTAEERKARQALGLGLSLDEEGSPSTENPLKNPFWWTGASLVLLGLLFAVYYSAVIYLIYFGK